MVLVQMKSCDRAQIGAFTLAVGVDIERLVAHQADFGLPPSIPRSVTMLWP